MKRANRISAWVERSSYSARTEALIASARDGHPPAGREPMIMPMREETGGDVVAFSRAQQMRNARGALIGAPGDTVPATARPGGTRRRIG